MQISNEVLIGLIAIASTGLGGWVYILKRKADAALEKARADKREADARAEQIESEAKARLLQVQSETSQSQNIMKLFEQQIIINQQSQKDREVWWEALEKKEKRDESNYRVLADGLRDVGTMVMTEVQVQSRRLAERIDSIPAKIQNANSIALGDFAKTLAGEMAVVIVEQFERHKIGAEMYPFPDPDDPDWRDEMIVPLGDKVTIRKEPRFWDNALLQKPCAEIAKEGEKLRVITGRMKDWVIVDKIASGERCWGWLKAKDVRVGEAEKQLA